MTQSGKPPQNDKKIPEAWEKADPKKSKSSVQSLLKGLRVLEAFSHGFEEMTLKEIADIAGFDAGTTFRMVNTLVDGGYIIRIPESTRFRLALKVLDLGFNAIARQDLRIKARPLLQTLVNEISETASFAVLEGSDVLYIERVQDGYTRLGTNIGVGTTIYAPATLIGRTMLAFLPEERLEKVLTIPPRHPLTGVETINLAQLKPILAKIKKDGYSIGESLIAVGLRLLSVPVLDMEGWAMGALSVVAPSAHSTNKDILNKALEPMRQVAAQIAQAQEASGSQHYLREPL